MNYTDPASPPAQDASPIVSLTPEQNAPAVNIAAATGANDDEVAKRLNQPDWIDVAEANWQLNMTGQIMVRLAAGEAVAKGHEEASAAFDPFAYFLQNRERYRYVAPFFHSGAFDHVRSPAKFQQQAEIIRQNIEAREQIARGDGGNPVANFAAGLLGPVNTNCAHRVFERHWRHGDHTSAV